VACRRTCPLPAAAWLREGVPPGLNRTMLDLRGVPLRGYVFYAWKPDCKKIFGLGVALEASSSEIWRKTISGGEGGCWRGKWGGLVLGYLLGKIFGGVIAIISFRPGGWMQQSAVPRCAILSVGSTGGIGQ